MTLASSCGHSLILRHFVEVLLWYPHINRPTVFASCGPAARPGFVRLDSEWYNNCCSAQGDVSYPGGEPDQAHLPWDSAGVHHEGTRRVRDFGCRHGQLTRLAVSVLTKQNGVYNVTVPCGISGKGCRAGPNQRVQCLRDADQTGHRET